MAEELSLSALAVRLGRAKSGLHKLAAKGQIPKLASGRFDPEAVLAALATNLDPGRRSPVHRSPPPVNEPAQTKVSAGGDYNAARTAETKLKVQLRQLQIDETSGRLIDADKAERVWADQMVRLRSRLLAVPSDVAQLLPHLTKHDLSVVDRALRDAMTEASEDVAA